MKNTGIILIILICFIGISLEKNKKSSKENDQNIELTAMAYSIDNGGASFNNYVESFNEYSKENNLNITLKINFISSINSTLSFNNMGLMVENLLRKKTTKYDILFYDNSLTSIYGPYLLNLSKWLPKEHIDMYNKDILSLLAYYNGNLVGLVILNFLYCFFYNNNIIIKNKLLFY